MNYLFIKNYINKLTINDVYNYAESQGIKLKKEEAEKIYYYIKNDWRSFLNNPEMALEKIKNEFSKEIYLKALEIYNKYKK